MKKKRKFKSIQNISIRHWAAPTRFWKFSEILDPSRDPTPTKCPNWPGYRETKKSKMPNMHPNATKRPHTHYAPIYTQKNTHTHNIHEITLAQWRRSDGRPSAGRQTVCHWTRQLGPGFAIGLASIVFRKEGRGRGREREREREGELIGWFLDFTLNYRKNYRKIVFWKIFFKEIILKKAKM